MKPEDFIKAVAPAAQAAHRLHRIPAGFTIAQAALESGWGSSLSATRGCNLFGVKASKAWQGEVFLMWTWEEDEHSKRYRTLAPWRKYPNWQASIDDHSTFLLTNKRYRPAFVCTDSISFARAVAAAGYATDHEYADKLVATIKARRLERFDTEEDHA